jgi:dTDP-glucose 4,6-dehydratase
MIFMVTGALGFIGSAFVRHARSQGHQVIGVDAKTYAYNPIHFELAYAANRYIIEDIATMTELPDVDVIVNFAAETHVDNSITDSGMFTHSNLLGVQNLLNLLRNKRADSRPRFIQISTDEVYGDSHGQTPPTEESPLRPSNPYSASKAAADLYIEAYARTYGISYNIIRPSNCWGRYQYKEKLIPKSIWYFTLGRVLPIHGDGTQTRSWLHVRDAAAAIYVVVQSGKPNNIYNIGGELRSINDVVRDVYDAWSIKHNRIKHGFLVSSKTYDLSELVSYDAVRPGMDVSYGVDDTKIRSIGSWVRTINMKDNKELLVQIVDEHVEKAGV